MTNLTQANLKPNEKLMGFKFEVLGSVTVSLDVLDLNQCGQFWPKSKKKNNILTLRWYIVVLRSGPWRPVGYTSKIQFLFRVAQKSIYVTKLTDQKIANVQCHVNFLPWVLKGPIKHVCGGDQSPSLRFLPATDRKSYEQQRQVQKKTILKSMKIQTI